MLSASFQACQMVSLPKTIMPISVSPKVKAPRVFVNQFPVGMKWASRESHEYLWFGPGLTAKVGGTDLGGSFSRCGWLADVCPAELSRFGGKAGSSIHSSLSIPGTPFCIGEGETEREVVLLACEFGRDESDDELVWGDRPGILGSGLSEEMVGSTTVGLSSTAIAARC